MSAWSTYRDCPCIVSANPSKTASLESLSPRGKVTCVPGLWMATLWCTGLMEIRSFLTLLQYFYWTLSVTLYFKSPELRRCLLVMITLESITMPSLLYCITTWLFLINWYFWVNFRSFYKSWFLEKLLPSMIIPVFCTSKMIFNQNRLYHNWYIIGQVSFWT